MVSGLTPSNHFLASLSSVARRVLYQLSYLGNFLFASASPLMVSGLTPSNHFLASLSSVARRVLYQLSYLGKTIISIIYHPARRGIF